MAAAVLPVPTGGLIPQQAQMHNLPHADGSARLSLDGFGVLATVNGPLEAQRRDELPNEAFIEVNVRPPSGPGSPRDRHIEQIVTRTLRAAILTTALPRSLVQITLQLVATPESKITAAPPHQSDSVLPSLAPLINAAVLALLSANVPLRFMVAALKVQTRNVPGTAAKSGKSKVQDDGDVDVNSDDSDDQDADEDDDQDGDALHVFAFDNAGNTLLCESEGPTTPEQWQAAHAAAAARAGEVHASLRASATDATNARLAWRNGGGSDDA